MDYNTNGRDNGQWDRWNSSASNSSYYNQPTRAPQGQKFILASFLCGLLSVTVCACGFSLPLGALGILFALLASRRGKPMDGVCRAGLTLSVIGTVMGVVIVIASQAYLFYLISLPESAQLPNGTQIQYSSDNYLGRYFELLDQTYEDMLNN